MHKHASEYQTFSPYPIICTTNEGGCIALQSARSDLVSCGKAISISYANRDFKDSESTTYFSIIFNHIFSINFTQYYIIMVGAYYSFLS